MVVDKFTEVPEDIKTMTHYLEQKFGVTIRPSGTLDMIKYLIGKEPKEEWDLMDLTMIMNGPFESYMIEKYQDFLEGREIELKELADAVMTIGDYSRSEKRNMNKIGLENITWAICLAILKNNINAND